MYWKRLVYLALLTFSVLPMTGQRLSVDVPREVGQGEPFHVTFSVEGKNVEDFRAPSLSGLDVLSGPTKSHMSSYQYVNGQSSSSTTTRYTYTVAARQTGSVNVGAATAVVDGHAVRSAPATVRVVAGSPHVQAPVSGASRDRALQPAGTPITERDVYVSVTPSRTAVFEQEAVLLTYRVHYRSDLRLVNVALVHKPDFSGLVTQEIPTRAEQTTTERAGGTTYKVGTILQYVVYPQQSGVISVPGIDFACTLAQRRQYEDPIDAILNGGSDVETRVGRSSRSLNLQVKPLPQPKPAEFSGGVGQFQLKGELITPVPASNDLATYRLTLSGSGNLRLITPPRVVFPKGVDAYAPNVTDHTQLSADGLKGSVTYDYTFVPRRAGRYTIPSATFVSYDPAAGRYVTLRTQPLTLDVKQGSRNDADVARDAALRKQDIRLLHAVATDGTDGGGWLAWGTWGYVLAYVLVVAFISFAAHLMRRHLRAKADVVGRRREQAGRVARRSLRRAKLLLHNSDESAFYTELSRALRSYLADKAGERDVDLTEKRIAEILVRPGISTEGATLFQHVLAACEKARFAPQGEAANRELLFNEASQAIDLLEGKR